MSKSLQRCRGPLLELVREFIGFSRICRELDERYGISWDKIQRDQADESEGSHCCTVNTSILALALLMFRSSCYLVCTSFKFGAFD